MFGVTHKPSLTIVKKDTAAGVGYLGIGTDAPEELVHINDGNLLLKSSSASSGAIILGLINNFKNFGIERVLSANADGLDFWRTEKVATPKEGDLPLYKNVTTLFLSTDGKVGVGTKTPTTKFEISGGIKATTAEITKILTTNKVTIADVLTAQNADITSILTAQSADITSILTAQSADITSILTAKSADITGEFTAHSATITGLVTADRIRVEDLLCAQEIIVQVRTCWPDYVFDKNYELMPLQELEQFVNENRHLPNVPSATEVETNGVNVAEMNAILLKKMEEMTLYIITLQKQIDELKNR
ncbi:MAG: hypothetical protein LBI45_08880 [Bacteroidales bacterium]|nr:hypothetical protein [Bacteroidales bacterium]